jgi:hypothetical protein
MRSVQAVLLSAIVALAAAEASSQAQVTQRRAFLASGADPVKGLPFFPPNALRALEGSYELGGLASPNAPASAPAQDRAQVWYTREAIVLGGSWRRTDLGAGFPSYALSRPQGPVYCVEASGYFLFLEPPEAAPAAWSAFAAAFARKFQAFFQGAASDAELSFPAFVDY